MIALLCAATLAAAAIAVWFVVAGAPPPARVHLRFASVLFAALAAARFGPPLLANEVALLVVPLSLAVLTLGVLAGFERPAPPLPAALALALVCLGGLSAAVTGFAALALAPATLATLAMFVMAARQFDAARFASVQGMLAAIALLAAVSSLALEGAASAHILFMTVGLLGLSLALSRGSDAIVEQKGGRDLRRTGAIGEAR